MENKKPKRHIKIQALCDQCDQIHEAEGKGGIAAILTKEMTDKKFEINVAMFAINNPNELLNLVVMLQQAVFKQNPAVMLQSMEIFMRTPGVAEAIMQRRTAGISGNGVKPKLEGIN